MSWQVQDAPISQLIGKKFYGVHTALRKKQYSSYWLRGGRGSLKSSFVAIETLKGIVADPLANLAAFRKVGATVKDSIQPTYEWAIRALNWEPFFEVIQGAITYKKTGQLLLLRGLDDPLKYKSMKTAVGYFKYLWFEEGDQYDSPEELRSVRQSVLRGGPEFFDFVSYNPPREPRHWINEEAKREVEGRLIHTSCYLDAPPEWLGPSFLKEAEDMRQNLPEKYAHEYLGVSIGRSDRIVFSGCYVIKAFTSEKRGTKWYIGDDEVDGPYFGADWGFSQDPTTLMLCWRSIDGRNIFIEHEVFGVGVKLDETPALFDKVPMSRKYRIRADSARPETIAHIKDRGFDIEGVEKWKGSVEDGIEWLKGHKIIIHERCKELQEEAVLYQYKVDRWTLDVRPDLAPGHDHGWDAVRYAFSPLIKFKAKPTLSYIPGRK